MRHYVLELGQHTEQLAGVCWYPLGIIITVHNQLLQCKSTLVVLISISIR